MEGFKPNEQIKKLEFIESCPLNEVIDLIDEERKIPEEYIPLIEEQEFKLAKGDDNVQTDEPFARKWKFISSKEPNSDTKVFLNFKEGYKEEFEELDSIFTECLTGRLLIDIGGGKGNMSLLAEKYDVSDYINVDRNHCYFDDQNHIPYENISADPTIARRVRKSPKHLNKMEVKSDMLSFLSKLKPSSANFVLNGIDGLIIDNNAYHEALAKELVRVTKTRSIIFGVNSRVLRDLHQYCKEDGPLMFHPFDKLHIFNNDFEESGLFERR